MLCDYIYFGTIDLRLAVESIKYLNLTLNSLSLTGTASLSVYVQIASIARFVYLFAQNLSMPNNNACTAHYTFTNK